ncbi:3D domain-containing protein [Chengkuizengella sp. SCS-71B]|uniref:3D domain-containing protein n=1 Tax=Chengkuizengella sp. SCS-71B TaxID=3115290 RepID=UPI0032C224F3
MFFKKLKVKMISILFLPMIAILTTSSITPHIKQVDSVEGLEYEESNKQVSLIKTTDLTSATLQKDIILEEIKKMKQEILKRKSEKELQNANIKSDKLSHSVEILSENQMRNQYQAVEVVATGYYAGVESTGKTPDHPEYGITYSGVKVRRMPDSVSTIAADLNLFPLGTVLYIPGYGYGIVADIGSAIKGNVIDLYFNSKEDVYKLWGKKKLDVFIIEEGNGRITEAILQQKMDIFRS